MKPEWSFPNNNHSIRAGISDSGIETFKGRIEQSLAREICQNSLDAADLGKRVRIEFELHEELPTKFPDINEFKSALNKAKKAWLDQKDTKTKDFLNSAMRTLDSSKLKILRISDFNTTGLTGSDDIYNSNWSNLIKASGSSDKSSTAGGSFGIGKFATFAASALRTVFYSTIDIDNKKASQGVARLVSFPKDDSSDELTQGIGFYGNPVKNQKISEHISFVSGYERSTPGTDIFIPGFMVQSEWEEKIIIEVLESFLMAIFDGTLEIKVGNYIVSKETLNDFFNKHHQLIINKSKNLYAQFLSLTSQETEWTNYSFLEESDVRVGILVDNQQAENSKISMIRRPWMKIYDFKPSHASYLSFSGICLIQGKKLNEILRKAENPQHTQWTPDRIENNPNERKLVQRYLKEIKESIINQINSLISRDSEDESDIEGLSDYLPMREFGSDIKETSVGSNSFQIHRSMTKAIPSIQTLSEKNEQFKTEELVSGGLIEGDDVFINTHHGDGSGGTGNLGDTPKGVDSSDDKLISIPQNTGDYELRLFSPTGEHNYRKLVIKSQLSHEYIAIKFFKLDEDGKSINLNIKKASFNGQNKTTEKNMISKINLSDDYSTFDLEFNETIPFTAEVKLYAVKK